MVVEVLWFPDMQSKAKGKKQKQSLKYATIIC